jgi:microcystin-dependent protein
MAEPFLGEIRMFAGNFAPRGWALCDGTLLSIAQKQALFALLGTTYGGDGRVTFALPDLRGRAPMHWGNGPGLTPRSPGERGGSESVALQLAQLPPHGHALQATGTPATDRAPAGKLFAEAADDAYASPAGAAPAPMVVWGAGSSRPHDNLPPQLVVNFIIALEGIFPARN